VLINSVDLIAEEDLTGVLEGEDGAPITFTATRQG
jgi:hypothetical protein